MRLKKKIQNRRKSWFFHLEQDKKFNVIKALKHKRK